MARQIPLIVVASASAGVAEEMAAQLRRQGAVVYATHSAEGCLRVATSIRPDVIVLDPALPRTRRFEQLLRAHPASASAQVRLMQLVPERSPGAAEHARVLVAA